jgi:hypothetical protein
MNIKEKLTIITENVPKIYNNGYNTGKSEVLTEANALNDQLEEIIYGAGTDGKSFYDEFWDNYQDYGNRAGYLYAFAGEGWTDETFKPKYDIKPIATAQGAFSENKITDFRSEAIGVEIDTSEAATCAQLFIRSIAKYIGTISFESATNSDYAFYQCRELESIEKIILKEDGTSSLTSAFNYCNNLKEVKFEGVLGLNNLNLQWSTKLSKASITNIINALSTTTSGLTVTLTNTAVKSAFGSIDSAEWLALVATKPNWTISLA